MMPIRTQIGNNIRDNIYAKLYNRIYDATPLIHKAYEELWNTIDIEVNNRRVEIKGNIRREYDTN